MRKRQAKARLRFDLTQSRIKFTVPSSDSDVKHLERTSSHSRGALAPEFLQEDRPLDGRGYRECRVLAAPAASRGNEREPHEFQSPQVRRNTPTFPARWFYGFLRTLLGDQALLPPSLANGFASLTPALGRLVPAFRSSCFIAATLSRTSESKGHWRLWMLQCRFRFEVPVADSRQLPQELQIGGTGTTRLRRPLR